jgi:hypothetical protein
MQKHERLYLEAATDAAQALGLEVRVLPRGRNPHLMLELVDPETGRSQRMASASCSPRTGDREQRNLARQAATRAARQLLSGRK